jgi:hypothetical protein
MKKSLGITATFLAFALAAAPACAGENVPAGTVINTTLATQTDLSTKSSQVGDGFSLRVVSANGGDPNFEGAVIRGHVADVRSAGQGRTPILTLGFDSITFADGTSAPLSATVTAMGGKKDNTTARQALGAGAGAAVGSQTVGRVIGGSAGSVVGLLGGAIGGLAFARNNKPNYDLAPGQTVTIQTQTALNVPRRQAGQ